MPDTPRDVPILSVASLADLGSAFGSPPNDSQNDEPDQVPVEFFDDPQHAPDCPLR